jgi:ribonuclease HI
MSDTSQTTGHSHAHLTLHVDGASLGNPGPAGAGFVLLDDDGEVVRGNSIPLGVATNNVAEYKALIAGLSDAAALGVRRLTVRSDSELMIKQLRGEYRVKTPHLRPLYEWCVKLARRFEKVQWEHVRREFNTVADDLAGEAAKRSRGSSGARGASSGELRQ